MKTKKYGFGSLMFLNEFTLDKIQQCEIDIIKLRLKLRTFKDFKIIVREEIENNVVYFYIEHSSDGEIIKCKVDEMLR